MHPLSGKNLMKQVVAIPEQLGPMLKAARKAAGLTQAALAARLGVSQSRVSDMEADPRSLGLDQFLLLLSLLDLEMLLQPKSAPDDARRPPW